MQNIVNSQECYDNMNKNLRHNVLPNEILFYTVPYTNKPLMR
jgi:hypothetical protein